MTCFACLGCTGHAVLPMVWRGPVASTVGSLVSRIKTQPACLQLACATGAGAVKGRACSLHSQIRGLAAGHMGVSILWHYLLHSARQESLWSGTSPVWDCLSVVVGQDLLGSDSCGHRQVGWGGSARQCQCGAHSGSKVSGVC